MTRSLLLLFLAAAVASAAPASPAKPAPTATYTQPQYFYTIDLDPRYQFTGTGALTEEDATRAKCYRFAYDSEGRPQQIEYRSAGVPMPDPLFGVARIDFERQPGLERRWFRDAHGQPTHNVVGTAGEELALNAAAAPTVITNIDESGGRMHDTAGVYKYERTLDNDNRVTSTRRLGLLGTNITDNDGYFETHTSYDLQGRAIERANVDSSGAALNNNDGIATIRTTYTFYPDATQTTESYFDASGLPASDKTSGVHQLQRTLDKRGFLVDEAYFDSTGAPMMTIDDNIHERRDTYDDRGNLVSEQFLDTSGKPVEFQNAGSFAKVVYKYDDKNRVVEQDYFGDDGKPQVPLKVGAAVVRQEYDDKGTLVRQAFFDGLGRPARHATYGAESLRINTDGDTTKIVLGHDDGRPMKNPIHGYYAFSYKTAAEKPVYTYYDRHGRVMTLLRFDVINPHLYKLQGEPSKMWSARLGVGAGGLGALLACFLALRKSSYTKRRRVYVPGPIYRFLGWLSVFAILEGALRFVMTIYWAWVDYQNGRLGNGIYVVETIFICFFLYRLYRLTVTMRVLNITSEDLHRVVRDFFTQAGLKPEWNASNNRYVTPALDVRVNYFAGKHHGYLGFTSRGDEGKKLAADCAVYIRKHARELQAPVRTQAIAFYYPSVALCYFLLAGLALYTLSQLIIGF